MALVIQTVTCLGLIPARGGSKGIPRKNIAPFCGRPLIEWTIESALSCNCIDQVIVSTDDIEIAEIARRAGADVPFLRPSQLAKDNTPGIAPVLHVLDLLPHVQELILLQPTSPLRSVDDIEQIQILRNKKMAESAVSVCLSAKHPAWMYTMNDSSKLNPVISVDGSHSRQTLPTVHVLNGALFSASRDFLLKERAFITADTIGFCMPAERSVDIDTPFDWCLAEFLMSKTKND